MHALQTQDLWAALSEASGKDVQSFMGVWTKEVGYPVVTLARDGGKLAMSQARFLSNGKSVAQTNSWWVPMTLLDSEGKSVTADLKSETGSVDGTGAMPSSWLKANAGQTAFFRVRYSDEMLAQLGDSIESLKLCPVDRLGVQSDAFALAKAGQLPTDRALALAVKYVNETDFTVWSDLAGSLGDVMGTWAKEDAEYAQLQKLLLKVMSKVIEVLGWTPKPGENALFPMLRPLIIGALGRNGHDAVKQEALDKMFKGGWQSVPADLRFAVYSIVVAHGGAEGFEAVFKVFKEADMAEERVRALRGLGDKRLLPVLFLIVAAPRADRVWLCARATLDARRRALPALLLGERRLDKLCRFLTPFWWCWGPLHVSGYTKEPALIDRLLGMTLDDSIRAQDVFYVYGTLAGKGRVDMIGFY